MGGPPELRSWTARISADLSHAGIRHAISGDVAMSVHGVGRSTFDVSMEDLVVLEMLWRRPKDVWDVQGLLAATGPDFDAAHVRSTLASILPADDPRHAELADWLREAGSA